MNNMNHEEAIADQLRITGYLELRLEDAEEIMQRQSRIIEVLMGALEQELDSPCSVDWDEVYQQLAGGENAN